MGLQVPPLLFRFLSLCPGCVGYSIYLQQVFKQPENTQINHNLWVTALEGVKEATKSVTLFGTSAGTGKVAKYLTTKPRAVICII